MKAMILAAGLGTRLRPLTDSRPKPLVEISGRTLLEIAIERLREYGIDEIIVNVHHFADMVVDYLAANRNFGVRIQVSGEKDLLDTGGGLKQAGWFFLDGTDRDEPFIVHNVDILSTIDLGRMLEFHGDARALATLGVQDRATPKYLLFDEQAQLCGRRVPVEATTELVRPVANPRELAFSGIHVISPRLLPMLTDPGAFSIIDAYLKLAGEGQRIVGFRADEYSWRDVGTPAELELARKERA